MPAPTIGALPTPPSRNNAPDVFASNADAFLGAFPNLRTDINALVAYLNSTAMVLGQFQDGTAALPSIRFETDPDTGFYRIAANTLGVSAGGSERARFTSSGMQVTGLISGTAVTQTDIDTTFGRLVKVGDFGLGANRVPTAPGSGLLDITPTGFYQTFIEDNPEGRNVGGFAIALNSGFSVETERMGFIHWEYSPSGSVRPSFGVRDNARTYLNFERLVTLKNILGTVSQSGGVPTGAVIERGSNANGGYVRFADGTQICWGAEQLATASTASGSVFVSNGLTFTFPAAFVLAPSGVNGAVTLSSRWVSGAAAQWSGTGADVTTTQVSCRLIAAVSGSQSNVSYIAIGRWF